MTPTNELRFVERTITDGLTQDGLLHYKRIRVWQQKWEGEHHENIAAGKYLEEWRDVEVVKEET